MNYPTGTALTAAASKVITDGELFAFIQRAERVDPDQFRRGHCAHVWAGRSSSGQDFVLLIGIRENLPENFAADVIAYQNANPEKIVFAKLGTFVKQLRRGMDAQEYVDAYNEHLQTERLRSTRGLSDNPFKPVPIAPGTWDAILKLRSQI